MGAWDVDALGNDAALDWLGDFCEGKDLKMAEVAISKVESIGTDYLDADASCNALAACEVIARLKGKFGKRDPYSEGLDKWVSVHPISPPPALVRSALASIDRIVTPPSELLELWTEGDAEEWLTSVAELRRRVE